MLRVLSLFVLTVLIATTHTFAQNVSLYAGTPKTSGHDPTGIPRLNAKFNNPIGVAIDKHGFLWVSEWSNHTIRLITPDGYVYTKAGGALLDCFKNAAATSSRYSNPSGICVGPDDTIYVADHGNHVIRRIDPTQGSLGKALWSGVKAGKFSPPGAGNPNCLTKYPGHQDGKWENAKFKNPADVDCDAAGNIYVADQGNHCIRKIGINGLVTTIAGIPDSSGYADGNALGQALFNWPVGIYVHTNGDIYVAEYQNSSLRKIAGGQVTTVLGYPPLWLPSDVYIDSRGIIYVSDLHRIIRWNGSKYSVFAGGSDKLQAGYVNDTATSARFDDTKQMVVDPNNYHFVYVADYNNHIIRKVTICDDYKPVVTLSGGTVFCKGDQLTLTAEDGYTKYMWSTGETTKSIVVTTTKDVSVQVLDTNLCWGYSDTFNVNVYTLKPTVTPTATSFCIGDSAFLVGQAGFDYYTWFKNGVKFKEGINEQTLVVYDSGSYVLEVISGPCTGRSDKLDISLGQLTPGLNYEGNQVLCLGDSMIVEPNADYNSYEWRKDGNLISTSKQIIIKEAGTYNLFASTAAGCSGYSVDLIVSTFAKPPKPTISTAGDSILVSSSLIGNQWYRNDTLLFGSTAPGYYATIPGWYKVVVTSDQTGCYSESDPFPFGGVSIPENNINKQLFIYPNPSHGVLSISGCSPVKEKGSVQILNMIGEIVYQDDVDVAKNQFQKEINVEYLEKGIYILLFRMDNSSQGHKIIIN